MKTIQERIESHIERVTESGCWIWIGSVNKKGYGISSIGRKTIRAHRMSYEIYKNKIPKDQLVLHHCDTPSCVNPYHLFLGNREENIKDARKKGRLYLHGNSRGENHGFAKFNSEQVLDIRNCKGTLKSIAKKYNVTISAIRSIKIKRTWKHI